MKFLKIITFILTFALACGVYFETGIITAVSIFLIFCAVEILPLRRKR